MPCRLLAAAEVEAMGGQALPLVCDIRDEEQVNRAVQQAVDKFGGIDILVNNASAINLTGGQAKAGVGSRVTVPSLNPGWRA